MDYGILDIWVSTIVVSTRKWYDKVDLDDSRRERCFIGDRIPISEVFGVTGRFQF